MHQIIIRILAPQVPVFDFILGKIVDGQFQPVDCRCLSSDILEHVQVSSFLGTQAYVESTHVSALTSAILNTGADMLIYPNFIAFNLPEGYVSKEEENAQ